MAKYVIEVGTNCKDPAKEAEYNDWYNNIHLPDVLETPGFVRATRYENTEAGKGQAKFIALYEVETDDIDAFMKANNANMAEKTKAGRISDQLVLVSRALYKETYSVKA
jgi:hypothetical protein